MKRKLIILWIVGSLGVIAATLGFVAEATRAKGNQIYYVAAPDNKCIFPGSPALALGLTAAVVLTMAQTILNVATGCFCCTRGTYEFDPKRAGAFVSSTLSWFAFIMAMLLLLTGAALNYKQGEESAFYGDYYCLPLKDGIFAAAAILSLITVVLGIVSFTISESADYRGDPWAWSVAPEQPGIAMGRQPQLPQQRSQDPMFLHEDTYPRQQTA